MVADDIRSEHAAAVPVYVRAEGDTWALVDTATDETVSTHATSRDALNAALDRSDVAPLVKRANLREDGEPVGAWRWLDASAEEDQPVDGSRITAASLWEMARSLNERQSAIPINGGGAPRTGTGDSMPHGDAYTGGDHLANGWAHVGLPVLDEGGRTHLFLRSELLTEIAAEVDIGRLAYGSIRFGFDEIDAEDNDAIKGALLISHALTNDPAVTTLTAGSERRRDTEPAFVAMRSRKVTTMAKKTTQRGPVADVLSKIAGMLGISAEDLEDDPWKVSDAVWALQDAKKVEGILDAVSGVEAPAAEESTVEAEARAVLRAIARGRAQRAEDMPVEEAVESADAMLTWAREVLGKPEATMEEAMAELEARKAEIGALLGTDTPEEPPPAVEEERAPEEEDEDEEDDEREPDVSTAEARAAVRATVRDTAAKPGAVRAAARALAVQNERYEAREWLDAQIAARKLAVNPDKRSKWTELAISKGRDVVLEILDAQSRPPVTNPLDGVAEPGAAPESQKAAYDACNDDAQRGADEDEAKRAKRDRRPVREVPRHEVRSRAQKLARERWPALFTAPPAVAAG
jgi:hypothetical protein